MSPHETGGQWDFPYAWAPDQFGGGTKESGNTEFNKEADRVSYEFLSTVARKFPARRKRFARNTTRVTRFLGNAGNRRLSHEHRGIWMDERSISFFAAPTAGKLRSHAWLMSRRRSRAPGALKLFRTNRRNEPFRDKTHHAGGKSRRFGWLPQEPHAVSRLRSTWKEKRLASSGKTRAALKASPAPTVIRDMEHDSQDVRWRPSALTSRLPLAPRVMQNEFQGLKVFAEPTSGAAIRRR